MQYQSGTATVTYNSPTVTGAGTLWATYATAGNAFHVSGDTGVYTIASVDSDTQITLTAPYRSPTGAGVAYQITRDYTPNYLLPEIYRGDRDLEFHLTEMLRKLDGLILTGDNGGYFQIDDSGGLMPITGAATADALWELDGSDDLEPIAA